MTRGFELRALEIARPRIEGTRSENASRSRRVTTTADSQRAMREQLQKTQLRASVIASGSSNRTSREQRPNRHG